MNKLFKVLILIFACTLLPTLGNCQGTFPPRFLKLTLDNKIIGPVTAAYIADGIAKAEKEGFSGVILVLDTPGGLLESTRTIVKTILNSQVPVIAYIAPSGSRAGSA